MLFVNIGVMEMIKCFEHKNNGGEFFNVLPP